MNTQLQNRTLWYDGCISVIPDELENFLGHDDVYVTKITPDIDHYNKMVTLGSNIKVKTALDDISTEWNIPEEYLTMDVDEYVSNKFAEEIETNFAGHRSKWFTDEQVIDRGTRLNQELKLFKTHGLMPLLRTLIYIINTFENKSVVWGPGRGSSVSSYILFLIKVHDVDSVYFELDITDFIRNKGE